MFNTNVGPKDRTARIIFAVILMAAGYIMGGTVGTVIGVIGLIPMLTGLMGYCPVYSLLRFNSCGKKGVASHGE